MNKFELEEIENYYKNIYTKKFMLDNINLKFYYDDETDLWFYNENRKFNDRNTIFADSFMELFANIVDLSDDRNQYNLH